MNKKDYMIVLGTAHTEDIAGKHSPDNRLREATYSREIVDDIEAILLSYGYNVVVDYRPLKGDVTLKTNTQSGELAYRANYVNNICKKFGNDKVVYVSIHVNAAPPNDGKWHNAGGWCAYTSVGQTKADKLAESLYDAAEKYLAGYSKKMENGKKQGLYGANQKPFRTDKADGDRDIESNFYILKNTACPAVLTENLFQDNEEDVKYLLSDAGRHNIVRLHVEGIINYLNEMR